jgi:uncharacterized protein (TIGR03086 family)
MQTISLDQLVRLDRKAVLASETVVRRCTDLTLSTPCAGWDLADLIAHMTVQHHCFARAVRGEATTIDDWRPRPTRHAGRDYVDACAAVLASFAAVADPAAPVTLPEVRDAPVPAQIAVGFHLVDYVVHTWDVAVSIGQRVTFDDDTLQAALAVAKQVPDGANRDAPGSAFAHALPVPPGASVLDEVLLLLGRDPASTP